MSATILPDRTGFDFGNGETVQFFKRGTHPNLNKNPWIACIETPQFTQWRGIEFIPATPEAFLEWCSVTQESHLEQFSDGRRIFLSEKARCSLTPYVPPAEEMLASALYGELPPNPKSVLKFVVHRGTFVALTGQPQDAMRLDYASDSTELSTDQRRRRNHAHIARFAILQALLNSWKETPHCYPPTALEVIARYQKGAQVVSKVGTKRAKEILSELGFDWLPQEASWAKDRLGMH